MQNAVAGLVVLVSISATAFDLRARRIPNFITLPPMAVGLGLSALDGWRALGLRLAGVVLLLAASMLLFSLRVLGGGDGKLIIAIAALEGLAFAGQTLLYALLIAGTVAVIVLLRRSALKAALMRAVYTISTGRAADVDPDASRIPLGPAIAAGAVITLAAQRAGWTFAELFS